MSNRGHILVAGPAGPALDDTALVLDQRGFATTVAPDAVTLGDLRADAVVLVGDPDGLGALSVRRDRSEFAGVDQVGRTGERLDVVPVLDDQAVRDPEGHAQEDGGEFPLLDLTVAARGHPDPPR